MTVTNQNKKVTATGNGSATTYSFKPIVINQASELSVVTTVIATGVETIRTQGTGAGNWSTGLTTFPATGSITYPADEVTPLPNTETITIKRVLVLEQQTDLENQGGYFPEVQETQYDKFVMIDLQQQEEVDRSVKVPVSTSTSVNPELPAPAANTVVGIWSSDALSIVAGPSADEITNAQGYAVAASSSADDAAADVVLTGIDVVSAGISETNAAASATAAALSASSNWASTIANKDDADSPIAPVLGDDGTIFVCDTTNGTIIVNLPPIAAMGEGYRIGIINGSGTNDITINRDGTDTIVGLTNFTLTDDTQYIGLAADDNTVDNWIIIAQSAVQAGSGLTKTGATLSLNIGNDQDWTGSQRSPFIVVTDGALDMGGGQNFKYTPGATDVLEFSNEAAGQSGIIHLINTGGETITLGSEVDADADLATTISAAGTYPLSYYCFDGTNVVVTRGLPVV